MSTDTISRSVTTALFPLAAVDAKLRSSLLKLITGNAAMMGVTLPTAIPAQYGAAFQIDSLDVVDLLCGLEPIVGFELKDSIVKAGGYGSINAAIEQLVPRIQSSWNKNGSKGAKK